MSNKLLKNDTYMAGMDRQNAIMEILAAASLFTLPGYTTKNLDELLSIIRDYAGEPDWWDIELDDLRAKIRELREEMEGLRGFDGSLATEEELEAMIDELLHRHTDEGGSGNEGNPGGEESEQGASGGGTEGGGTGEEGSGGGGSDDDEGRAATDQEIDDLIGTLDDL